MKKCILFLSLLSLIIACKNNKDNVKITGNIEDFQKGTIYLEKEVNGVFIPLDSSILEDNGSFTFSTEIDSPKVLWVTLKNWENASIPVFADPNTTIHITSHIDSLLTPHVSGSKSSISYQEYVQVMRMYREREDRNYQKFLTYSFDSKKSLANEYYEKYLHAKRNQYLFSLQFMKNHPDEEVSAFIGYNFLDQVTIPALEESIGYLSPEVQKTYYGKAFIEKINIMKKSQVGSKMAPISQLDQRGVKVNFPNGKKNLFVFGYLGHPNTVLLEQRALELYAKKPDLDVVFVMINTDKALNKSYFIKDSLNWYSVYDTYGNNNKIFKNLGLRNIPNSALISQDGTIIAKDLPLDEYTKY